MPGTKDGYLKACIEKSHSAILSPLVHHHFIDLFLIKGKRRVEMIQEAKIFPLWKNNKLLGAIIIIRDFTEQIEHESGLMEKTKALNALRNINRMMVRENTREAVFSQSVKILARDMGLSLVWFAIVKNFSANMLIGAYDGIEQERFRSFQKEAKNYASLPPGLILTRQAIETGTLQLTHRNNHSPEMGPWWNLFKDGHCNTAVAIPLFVEDRIIAVLHIHIKESRGLSKDILELFQELADNISLTLKKFHDLEVRHETELKIQAEKERLLVTLKGIGDAVLVCDAKGQVILMNPVAETSPDGRLAQIVRKVLDETK